MLVPACGGAAISASATGASRARKRIEGDRDDEQVVAFAAREGADAVGVVARGRERRIAAVAEQSFPALSQRQQLRDHEQLDAPVPPVPQQRGRASPAETGADCSASSIAIRDA